MSQLSVEWEDPATTILALLLCGHVLAVFLFESNWMIREEMPSLRAFLVHALNVGLVQGSGGPGVLVEPPRAAVGRRDCAHTLGSGLDQDFTRQEIPEACCVVIAR